MGKHYKSKAKLNRSTLRLLEFKKTHLEDLWDCEIKFENQEVIWKASKILNLTLKRNIRIVETREYYNPSFVALPVSEKLEKFQSVAEKNAIFKNYLTY